MLARIWVKQTGGSKGPTSNPSSDCLSRKGTALRMGQKWGKPYANQCHPVPIMHLCNPVHAGITASKHGPFTQNPPHTPTQLGVGGKIGNWLIHQLVSGIHHKWWGKIGGVGRTLIAAVMAGWMPSERYAGLRFEPVREVNMADARKTAGSLTPVPDSA